MQQLLPGDAILVVFDSNVELRFASIGSYIVFYAANHREHLLPYLKGNPCIEVALSPLSKYEPAVSIKVYYDFSIYRCVGLSFFIPHHS